MRPFNLLLVLAAALFGSCHPEMQEADLKKMEWLLGTWKGESDGKPFYEEWTKINDTRFDNRNYSLCNGDTLRGGFSTIELRNGKIVYASDALVWDLKELNDSAVVFESTQYGERFTFSKKSTGEWLANLKYPQHEIDYQLSRTISIPELLKDKPTPMAGNYAGYLEFMNKKLHTSIRFDSTRGVQTATVTTPDNLQLDMPFTEVCYNPPFITLRLRDGTQNLELNGKVNNEEITGTVAGEIPAKIYLRKVSDPAGSTRYQRLSVSIPQDDTALPANLYLPIADKPVGAVIMICGTGQHVKEEYNGWADLLASKGVAVLTYNKRNVTFFPELNIRHASSDIVLPGQLESDIESAIRLLKNRSEINPKKIGLLGFSQGAVLAPVVASQNADVAFIVAVSGNTTTDKEFIINQAVNRLIQRNSSEEEIAETRDIWDDLFKYTKDKQHGDNIQKKLDKAYEKGFGRYSLPRQLPNDDEIKYLSTWNSFEHDPANYWSKLSIPAYVVYGGNDWFIPVKESVEILNSLYRNKTHLLTLKMYPQADHFIKNSIDRNNFDFPKYADNYIADMTEWIIQQTNEK